MLNTNFNQKILLNIQQYHSNLFELLTLAIYILISNDLGYGGYALCNVVDSNEQEKGNWGLRRRGWMMGLGVEWDGSSPRRGGWKLTP